MLGVSEGNGGIVRRISAPLTRFEDDLHCLSDCLHVFTVRVISYASLVLLPACML